MSSSRPEDADNSRREPIQRRMKRVSIALAPFMAFMGWMAFRSVASNPRFETIHTLDVIRLMLAGAEFAFAISLLILFFKLPGPHRKTNHHP